ncbi:MAG: DUF4172 domain-containing protein [Gammaproteobacteria bacterium]
MNGGNHRYIWQASAWPRWSFDLATLAEPMSEVSRAQGRLFGRLADVGVAQRGHASLSALAEDVVKTSAIEGEQLDVDAVRSSIARKLGVDIGTLHRAVDQAQLALDAVLFKSRFWQRWATASLNERQVRLLNRLLEGFEGKLTSSKWATIAKCSPDTALRDINDLVSRGVLRKSDAGGRSTGYELRDLTP